MIIQDKPLTTETQRHREKRRNSQSMPAYVVDDWVSLIAIYLSIAGYEKHYLVLLCVSAPKGGNFLYSKAARKWSLSLW